MKATYINSYTLVGFPTTIGVKGNCMSMHCEDGSTHMVANIGRESLLATFVQFPIEGEVRDGLFYVTDERIPKEAYRTGEICFCMKHFQKEVDNNKLENI